MLDGDKPANTVHHITIDILNSEIVQDLKNFFIRDPDGFVSGAINNSSDEWLKHFGEDLPIQIKAPSPFSEGVDIFAQDVSLETNSYVYPPISIIFKLLAFLKEQRAVVVDLKRIDDRIMQLHNQSIDSSHRRRRESLQDMILDFLDILTHKQCLDIVSSHDVKRFLVWKDNNGKTQIDVKSYINFGKKGVTACLCPIRLASGTVENLISYLTDIFESVGRVRTWNAALNADNPAVSETIKAYLKAVQEEQARAHIVPKQAKPIFINKVRSITVYISRELKRYDLTLRERFVLQRDQALLKLHFFLLSQELKKLNVYSGFVFNHTFGKALRGGSNKCNTFVLKRCDDKIVCPVSGLESYYTFMKNHEMSLKSGHLFRIITESGRVLEKHVSYSSFYERFRGYLITLGIFEGDTAHSIRAGGAIMLALSDNNANTQGVMNHIGWKSERMAHYYTRASTVKDASHVACN
ncbi:unnamed protein product [Mytilus coruscus]|uniref:ALOG domain-containing protein n=1 Tax=Mytilus coruscus TaxID=42192 RepID=A0A6J8A176_MYTCO|nr:unnamed protein product [Mytilus coruscus]